MPGAIVLAGFAAALSGKLDVPDISAYPNPGSGA